MTIEATIECYGYGWAELFGCCGVTAEYPAFRSISPLSTFLEQWKEDGIMTTYSLNGCISSGQKGAFR